ncbi:MAG: DNA repair protein RecO [Gammaproteobacteria bacterium]|nr:DNA repair protein RecO [Gammaproteobacteria bacterium]
MIKFDLISAYLIHAKSFRETSLLIDFFTKEHGFIKSIAKGVRTPGKNNQRGLLQPFSNLLISCRGRNELMALSNVEIAAQPYYFTGKRLAIAFYCNELLYYFGCKSPGVIFEDLFDHYQQLLASLANFDDFGNIEYRLREFELDLLTALGYGLQFNNLEADKYYGFDFVNGFILSNPQELNNNLSKKINLEGELLLNIMQRNWDVATLQAAKKLIRAILQYHLGGQELHSRKLLILE